MRLTNKTLTLPVIASISNGGTLTLPTSSDTLVARATSDTLLNKNITGLSNYVDANVLRNGSTWAMPLGGAAPATNNVLTFDGTQALWSAPASVSSVTMGGNVTGSSSACTVVSASGNFAVTGNQTVGGTLGVTGAATVGHMDIKGAGPQQ